MEDSPNPNLYLDLPGQCFICHGALPRVRRFLTHEASSEVYLFCSQACFDEIARVLLFDEQPDTDWETRG